MPWPKHIFFSVHFVRGAENLFCSPNSKLNRWNSQHHETDITEASHAEVNLRYILHIDVMKKMNPSKWNMSLRFILWIYMRPLSFMLHSERRFMIHFFWFTPCFCDVFFILTVSIGEPKNPLSNTESSTAMKILNLYFPQKLYGLSWSRRIFVAFQSAELKSSF